MCVPLLLDLGLKSVQFVIGMIVELITEGQVRERLLQVVKVHLLAI